MDRITIRDISLYAYHGVLPEEKERGQEFRITVELALDLKGISKNDRLENTVDYSTVLEEIKSMVQKESYNLLETLAERMASRLLNTGPILEAKVTVSKPRPPLAGITGGVEVSVSRKKYSTAEYPRHTVCVGLGANLGNRSYHLQQAVEKLNHYPRTEIAATSCIYETEPVGIDTSQNFYNAALLIKTSLSPVNFLIRTKETERELGRSNKCEMSSRYIDIDLLHYQEVTMNTPLLSLPHPSIPHRWFVLVPLNEICPDLQLPGYQQTVKELLNSLGEPIGIKNTGQKLNL